MNKEQLDLFKYPNVPGFKRHGTSQRAAIITQPRAGTLRARILEHLSSANNGLTPDECAALMNETVLSVRPRFSELSAMGLIAKTGEERRNESGLMADVYQVCHEAR